MFGSRRLSASGRVLLAMTAMLALTVSVLVAIAYTATARALTAEIDAALQSEAQAYSAAMKGAAPGDALTQATRAYLGARTAGGTGHDFVLLVTFGPNRATVELRGSA